MYISVGKGEKAANTGSCQALVTYLEKENKEATKPTYFFDQHREDIEPDEVIQAIDQNVRKLGKEDAKYFMVTVSPSSKELQHIQNDPTQLLTYARAVMEEYARSFQRGITGEDLLYFGKIEQGRTFTGADPAVQLGIVPAGSPKPGLHTHVHILVSRKDKSQRLKLSPETNHRTNKGNFQGGFNKIQFFLACEQAFDQQFAYARTPEERFAYWREGQQARTTPSLHHQAIQQVRAVVGQALQDTPTLLTWAQQLIKQGVRPILEKDGVGQITGIRYQLDNRSSSVQQGGRIVLTRDEKGKPVLGYQLRRQIGSQVAKRPISPSEKDQLLRQGYTDYLTGFVSRLGKPFTARLYFDAQNKLKFSFTPQVPTIATPASWTKQELKEFVFPSLYGGILLTAALKKQLMTNQVTDFLPRLVIPHQPATSSHELVHERELGPGFEFVCIRKKMGQEASRSDIEQVEKWLAQHKVQASFPTEMRVDKSMRLHPDRQQEFKALSPNVSSSPSSFLQKAWYKLGFSQPEEEASDNRLQRFKKRRRKRKFLNLA